MKNKPFDLARLAGDFDNIELYGQLFPIKGPGEFFLVPLARLSLQIERLYETLKVKNPDLDRAENTLNNILAEIMPALIENEGVFSQLNLEEKLEILDVFNSMEREESDPGASAGQGQGQAGPDQTPGPPDPTDWFKVIPRLQKFYGGSPRDWFKLELKWLSAFSSQMESLKAEYILDMSKANLAGTWPTSEEQKAAIEELINQLGTIVEGIENKEFSQEEIENRLEQIGIGVRKVEATASQMAAIERALER